MRRAYSRTKLSIVPGVSIVGNKESRLDRSFFYATNNFNNKNMLRYDFVETLEDGYNQLAQVLVLLKYSSKNNSQSKFFAIVRYLNSEPIDLKSKLSIPFQVYTWEIPRSRQYLQRYSLQMTDVAAILSPVSIHSYSDEKTFEPNC